MFYYLIEYDRPQGRLISLARYEKLEAAERARIDRELASKRETGLEIVILQAASEEQLRTTHGRYFTAAEELTERAKAEGRAAAAGT